MVTLDTTGGQIICVEVLDDVELLRVLEAAGVTS
jgi:hypothetical protein